MSNPSFDRFWNTLPALFLAVLFLCLSSGVVLLSQYRPFGDVFGNVEEIYGVIPFGFFIRRIHYFSGHLCVILALMHVMYYFSMKKYSRSSVTLWSRLNCSLAVCFLLLLTGFILKADKEAYYAATVLKSLLMSLPLIGQTASSVVVGQGEMFFFLPYLHHCFSLPLLLYLLLRRHIKQWFPEPVTLLATTVLLGAWCMLVPLPLPVMSASLPEAVKGPWFFLGFQELLKHGPAFWVGIFTPLLCLGLFDVLPALKGRTERMAWWLVAGSMGGYALLAARMLAT